MNYKFIFTVLKYKNFNYILQSTTTVSFRDLDRR
jgi:hypothetical protein